ncbi:MAG TPA: translesion error-prone DNA polymerase V autoproteolytic subunit [Thermodesulfobacteriota bacterium]|nr:translesion error-prone DNA polymerase V autoproteolytic subunit [Thermodesulfobacteriota bacterium]
MRVTEIGILKSASEFEIPLVSVRAPCGTGFPSPADDYAEEGLDLNRYVTEHPEATLYARAEGDSMIGAGIFDGDILVVDKALVNNANGRVITAWYNGHFTVKRLYTDPRLKRSFLISENPKYPPIEIHPETDFAIWAVVTWNVHRLSRELPDDVKSILYGMKK